MHDETQASQQASDIHRARGMAESFGVDAERYDRARPSYPDALVERIVAASAGLDFLDVGCGTGIAARHFLAAGCAVLGVEPDARMADFARQSGVEVEVATFEDWEPAGRTFDAVVAGTTWHWVDPDVGPVKAHQVLRPGGRLALFWHVFQPPREVASSLADVIRRVLPDAPVQPQADQQTVDAYQPVLTAAADGISRAGGFTEPDQWRYDWRREYTREEWLDQMTTTGILTRVSSGALAQILAEVGATIDGLGGSVTVEAATMAVVAERTSGD